MTLFQRTRSFGNEDKVEASVKEFATKDKKTGIKEQSKRWLQTV